MEDFEDLSWFILRIKDWKKNRDKFMEKYIHFGLLCVLICAFTKNIKLYPHKKKLTSIFCVCKYLFQASLSLTQIFPLLPAPPPEQIAQQCF